MHSTALRPAPIKLLNDRSEGSITLFLSMILVLVLALTGTLLEGARLYTIRRTGREALMTAMDAVLTEYYRPLYDDYHLFFMRGEAETEEKQKEILFGAVSQYLSAYAPEWDKKANLLSFFVRGGGTDRITRVVEQENSLFLEEAAAYMKYLCPATLLEDFSEDEKHFSEAGKTSDVIEKKQEAEEKLGELNRDILEIIELVEGLSVNRQGIRFGKNGKIKTEKNFVKRLCPSGIYQDRLGIHHPLVWNALKSHYCNPVKLFQNIKQGTEEILEWEKKVSELSEKRAASDGTPEGEGISPEEQKQLDGQITEWNRKIGERLSALRKDKKLLTGMAGEIIKKIDQADRCISGLKGKQKTASESLDEFRIFLEDNKGEINSRAYQGLSEERQAMEEYVSTQKENGAQSTVSHIIAMKPILLSNKNILMEWGRFKEMPVTRDEQVLLELGMEADRLAAGALGYDTASLTFDYEGLVCEPDTKDPAAALRSFLGVDLLEALVPEGKVSDRRLQSTDQPSGLCGNENRESNICGADYSQILKKSDEQCQGEVTGSFEKTGKSLETLEQINEHKEDGLRILLLWEYAKKHLNKYGIKSAKKAEDKETALLYEQEYVIAGKDSDEDNLRTVVHTIVFLRTVCNFISILGDREKEKQAYITAAALVGFTGLEPLVRLTRTLLLVVWGFEEALVDVAVILKGGRVPLIKDSKEFKMTFADLILVSRELIQKKASNYQGGQEGAGGLTYDDYLRIFFLLGNKEQGCGRIMDLIQENMRLRYDKSFLMRQCIYGYQVHVELSVPPRFLTLPFFRPYGEVSGYLEKVSLECSY